MAAQIWLNSVGGYRRNIGIILCKKIIVVLDFIESSTPWRYTCLLLHRESIAGWMCCRYLLDMLWRVGQLASVEVANHRHWYGKSQYASLQSGGWRESELHKSPVGSHSLTFWPKRAGALGAETNTRYENLFGFFLLLKQTVIQLV
jgi:hypothetical protein